MNGSSSCSGETAYEILPPFWNVATLFMRSKIVTVCACVHEYVCTFMRVDMYAYVCVPPGNIYSVRLWAVFLAVLKASHATCQASEAESQGHLQTLNTCSQAINPQASGYSF